MIQTDNTDNLLEGGNAWGYGRGTANGMGNGDGTGD
jgi:hypothetical protein